MVIKEFILDKGDQFLLCTEVIEEKTKSISKADRVVRHCIVIYSTLYRGRYMYLFS